MCIYLLFVGFALFYVSSFIFNNCNTHFVHNILYKNRLCDRNFCVGGDGVIFALKAPEGKKYNTLFFVILFSIIC